MISVRVVLSVALGCLYSVLVVVGIGLWMPFIFLPVLFLVCCLVAWRNVSLWYEQGEDFEKLWWKRNMNAMSSRPTFMSHVLTED